MRLRSNLLLRGACLVLLGGLAAPAAPAQPGPSDEVVITLVPVLPVIGRSADVQVRFEEGEPPSAVSLFYRRTGAQDAFAEVEGVQDAADPFVFRARLPDAALGPSGLDVFARYVRGGATWTEPAVSPEEDPIRFPVIVPQLRADVRLVPRAYRMVSVPLQFPEDFREQVERAGFTLGGTVEGIFGSEASYGAYDPSRWRILQWDPAAEAYREGPEEIAAFEPGRAVWLANALGAGFRVEAGIGAGAQITASGTQPMRVALAPGWNQIGSPFLFPVAWEAVGGSEALEEPVRYEEGEYRRDVSVLAPWEGYFVYNPTGQEVVLTFEPVAATDDGAEAPPFAERHLGRAGQDAYLLQLEAEGGGFRDRDNFVGVAARAEGGRLDRAKAPPIGEGLRLRVLDGGAVRAVSMRPAGEGQAWEVELHAGEGLGGRPATVTLREHGRRPPGAELFVLDLDKGEAADVRGGRFPVHFGGAPVRRFRVLLGSASFAGAHAEGLPLWPEGPALEVPYPNPLGGGEVVRFAYRIGRPGPARLAVYDLLGRLVHELVDAEVEPGWHEVAWDGRGAGGEALAAGVYLAVLRAPGGSATQKLTLLR